MLSGLAFAGLILGPAVAAATFVGRGAQIPAAIAIGGVTAVLVAVVTLTLNLDNADSGPLLAVVAAVTLGVVSFGLTSIAALIAIGLRNRH